MCCGRVSVSLYIPFTQMHIIQMVVGRVEAWSMKCLFLNLNLPCRALSRDYSATDDSASANQQNATIGD